MRHLRRRLTSLLFCALALGAASARAQGTGSSVQIFGPKQYVRTTGAPNQYTDTFAVPAWIAPPYKLHVQNGDPSGTNRVSSATISINGVQVAGPSDFNQNVATLDRNVTLTAQTTLQVTLASKPGSYLIINLGGPGSDRTPPVLAIAAPANGKAVNTATPSIQINYDDLPGTGEAGASGVNLASLKVLLDGVDRTSLFTRRSGDASAVLPADLALAPGQHTLNASVSDFAGNTGSATSRFTVDLSAPQIRVAEPAAGAYLATATPALRVTYQDNTALDLATLKILVNGTDRTALFTKTASEATLTLTAATALPQGANQITAQIADTAGNLAVDASAFNVDLTPPVLTVVEPVAGAHLGTPDVQIALAYRDDQALDLSTLRVTLDGTAIQLTATADGATGTATGIANGTHSLTARIRDKAGNLANATISFVVDTSAPDIQVVAPAPGDFLNTASPRITVSYSDDDGVSPATLKIRLNGTDVTNLFTAGASGATADLAGRLTIPDGLVTLTAQIANLSGIVGSTTSTFTVDTAAPTLSITAPSGPVSSGTPAAAVTYSDGGAGIDTATFRVLLDGVDATRFFAVAAGQAVGTLEVVPPLSDGPHTLEATVADRAGNPATASSSFVVDTTLPEARFVKPADNAFLNTPTPALELSFGDGTGSGVDTASLRVYLAREDEAEIEITEIFTVETGKATGQISAGSPLSDATYHLRATLRDRAGNLVTARATFELDTVAPTYQIVQPAQSSALATRTPAILFTYEDARSGVDPDRLVLRIDGVDKSTLLVRGADQATATVPVEEGLADGTHTLEVTVEDRAGNVAAVVPQTFIVDTVALAIEAVLAPPPNAQGWNTADVTVTFTCTDGGSGVADCPAPVVVSTEGAGQIVRGTARDAAGNTAETQVTVNLDKTPPAITELTTPDRLPSGGTGTVSATAADNLTLASVVFQVDGAPAATLTEPPYQFVLTVPASARAGDTLTVTAVAADLAGNSTSSSRGVTVAAQGIVVGQVLSDATGLPLAGATVQVVGSTRQDVSKDDGRYSIPVDGSHLFLRITKSGMLPVEREIAVQPSVGTVAVDARLTAVASPGSGTLTAGNVTVQLPSGATGALTRRSGQGLPALLPLGWSPIAAFDLTAEGVAGPFAASFTGVPAGQELQLATYNPDVHAWTLTARDLTSPDGALATEIPAPGSYAIVVADAAPAFAVPEIGQPLPGAEMVLLPADATSSGSLTPASLTPAGGTARAALAVQSSIPLPSGTVLQANVTESYTPASGEAISEAARSQDLVLYRYQAPAGAALAAEFPVTPSRTFAVADLLSGKVHLDILAGREGVRGQTGGSGAVVVQSGDASLAVSAGSLPLDTAIALSSQPLASFLPLGNRLTPLVQYRIDFAGATLSLPAQLSAAAGAAQPGDTLLLAQIQRFGGVPRLVVVSLAQVTGGQIVSQPAPGLPGITQGGEYVFYRLADPLGFVAGHVAASGAPVAALVQTNELPFVAVADLTGRYTLVALPGTAHVKATVPQTALLATGTVAVTAGETAALDLVLAGSVSAATVNPPDGALGVDPNAGITITAAVALNPATVTAANLQLFQVGSSGNQPVAVRFVLAQGNRQVSIFPLAALQPSTRYTLQVSGLATAVGGLVAVPSVTFTTRAATAPNFNPDALVFGFPDDEGNVAVSAPAGSFPPGTKLLIVDQTSGVVISLTVGNDGSVSGRLPATIDDVLLVTITAPDKSTTTFTRSQFVAPDGTVAIGSGGGTVTGPGGVELRIPEGALDKGVRLKIEGFGPERFPERPEIPEGHFGSGLKVSSPDKLFPKKELDLTFPKPADAPDGSFYYVYRRLSKADGTVAFEVIDQAFVQGDKVVTASPPFPGFITGMAGLANNPATSALASSFEDNYFYMMWSYERELVGIASQGLIVGKVLGVMPPAAGQTDPTYVGLSGALVSLSDGGLSEVAISQADGRFSIWDHKLGGGTRKVQATYGGETMEATAFEVSAVEPDPVYFPNVELFRYYRNVGKVNIAFALAPPPPAPQVDIRLFTLDSKDLRVPATGVVQSGSSLVIAFKTPLTVTGATAGGVPLSVTASDVPDNPQDPLRFDARVVGNYSVGPPGVYTMTATALPPLGGAAVTATRSILVVAAGGGNTNPTPGVAPRVVDSLPIDNAARVATTAFPQVTFSEPVTQVPGNVTLIDDEGEAVDVRLIGVRRDGSLANPVGAADAITALTLQPTTGLKFGTTYTLTLGSGIADLNQPSLQLAPFTLRFTTFGPQELGGSATFSSTRPVVIGQRAYVGKLSTGFHSSLSIVDISDPSNPAEVGSPAYFTGRAIDIAGMEVSPVTQGPLVAVAAGVGAYPMPSNVWIYDVSDPDTPQRVAAVSATTSAGQDGTLLRIAMKGSSIYTSTFPKGIQVIDVRQAVADYQDRVNFGERITTEGQGFATDAVVNTIELKTGQGGIATMYDVEAGDFAMTPPDPEDPSAPVPTETLVVATGRLPLVVVNPLQSGATAVLYPPRDNSGLGLSSAPLQSADGRFRLESGFSVVIGSVQRTDALGNRGPLPVALVAGTGTASTGGSSSSGVPILAVVDMSNPRRPAPLGFLKLRALAGDIALQDSLALIGTGAGRILLVNLQDPTKPFDAGEIEGQFGDRLALTDSRVVLTSSFNGNIGGIHTALLGSPCAAFRSAIPSRLPSTAPVSTSDPSGQLAWSFTSQLSEKDGLVLTNVKLGRRLMAEKMSLPYVKLTRNNGSLVDRFELTPTSSAATKRVRLLSFQSPSIGRASMATEARYLIDFLDGDVDAAPEKPDSCLVVTQRYEFQQEGQVPFEPFGKFPSARFVPLVKYSYFTDANGPKLSKLTAAQRFVFDARTPSQPLTPDLKAGANATMMTCDPDPLKQFCLPSLLSGSFVGLLHGKNPLEKEEYREKVIENGEMKTFLDFAFILPKPMIIDNFHSSPQPLASPDQEIDEPAPTEFGCPACVHVHWRWSSILKAGSVADYIPGAVIDPAFYNNDGKPFLAPGSKQDLDIAVEASGVEHPTGDVKDLINSSRSILPSALGSQKPAFWYIGTGKGSSDQFFTHGGGFGTFYVNKISLPRNGASSIQVEHSRDVSYEVRLTEWIFIGHGTVPFVRDPILGTLHSPTQGDTQGEDEISLPSPWSPESLRVEVSVVLRDPSLAQRGLKSEYVKNFTFTTPGEKEP